MDVTPKLFFDTNILLDVVLRREPFFRDSAAIWAMCESGEAKGLVSAISLNNVHYVASKWIGRDNAMSAVRLILAIFLLCRLIWTFSGRRRMSLTLTLRTTFSLPRRSGVGRST